MEEWKKELTEGRTKNRTGTRSYDHGSNQSNVMYSTETQPIDRKKNSDLNTTVIYPINEKMDEDDVVSQPDSTEEKIEEIQGEIDRMYSNSEYDQPARSEHPKSAASNRSRRQHSADSRSAFSSNLINNFNESLDNSDKLRKELEKVKLALAQAKNEKEALRSKLDTAKVKINRQKKLNEVQKELLERVKSESKDKSTAVKVLNWEREVMEDNVQEMDRKIKEYEGKVTLKEQELDASLELVKQMREKFQQNTEAIEENVITIKENSIHFKDMTQSMNTMVEEQYKQYMKRYDTLETLQRTKLEKLEKGMNSLINIHDAQEFKDYLKTLGKVNEGYNTNISLNQHVWNAYAENDRKWRYMQEKIEESKNPMKMYRKAYDRADVMVKLVSFGAGVICTIVVFLIVAIMGRIFNYFY